jgi:hypothetical protein
MEKCKKKISFPAEIYNLINSFFLKKLKKYWLFQYIGPIYPGIVAHFNKNLSKNFKIETIEKGEAASIFFDKIGLKDFASKNGGICTFKLGKKLALYQTTNLPLIKDTCLSPSTGPNKKLFGNFMGTYASDNLIRQKKRGIIIKKLSNIEYLKKIKPYAKKYAAIFLENSLDKELSLESFTMDIVSYVDSYLPGILDVTNKPLTGYLQSSEDGKVMRDFFELASDVISKLDYSALSLADSIGPVIKKLIKDNYETIKNADESNIIRQFFSLENISFDRHIIDSLPSSFLKELGTIIIALYDTTSLSLYWLICFIENNPAVKQRVRAETRNEFDFDTLSYIELVIIESIRLAGNNPTALWREVKIPTDVYLRNNKIHLREGMMLWLDRRASNQDNNIFPKAENFDTDNITSILKKENESIFSLLSHNRYEINSFSMVNTFNNPRKCPGRYFSILIQSCLLREIYSNYKVISKNTDVKLRKHCSMPRPDNAAKIIIHKKIGD